MKSLSNALLIETFQQAKKLHLDQQFIELLQSELNRRHLLKQEFEKINS